MSYQGSEFDSRVVLAKESKISSLSKCEVLTVGTTAKLLDLSTGEPTAEDTIFLCGHPAITDVVYIGLSNTVTTSSGWFATIAPNEKLAITINNENPPTIYAIGTNANDKIAVMKGL